MPKSIALLQPLLDRSDLGHLVVTAGLEFILKNGARAGVRFRERKG